MVANVAAQKSQQQPVTNGLKKAKTILAIPHANNQSTVESSESSSHVSSGQSSQSKSDKAAVADSTAKESQQEARDKCKLRLEEFKKSIKKNMALCD